MLSAGSLVAVELPAASSVHYTTTCKHNLVLLKMGEIIVRNMLSSLKVLINRYFGILLVVYIIVSVMHGHTNIKWSNQIIWPWKISGIWEFLAGHKLAT